MVLEQLEQFGEEQPVGQYGGSSSGSWERETGNGKRERGPGGYLDTEITYS